MANALCLSAVTARHSYLQLDQKPPLSARSVTARALQTPAHHLAITHIARLLWRARSACGAWSVHGTRQDAGSSSCPSAVSPQLLGQNPITQTSPIKPFSPNPCEHPRIHPTPVDCAQRKDIDCMRSCARRLRTCVSAAHVPLRQIGLHRPAASARTLG